VRYPRVYDQVMCNAGGQGEGGSRRWLIEGRRNPDLVVRTLQRTTGVPAVQARGLDFRVIGAPYREDGKPGRPLTIALCRQQLAWECISHSEGQPRLRRSCDV
jgi:hypothetical protein